MRWRAVASSEQKVLRREYSCRHDDGGWDMDKWKDSSTVGFVGCFFVFLALLLLGAWAAWQILEYNIPG
jgi:hypothetical protein